MLADALLAEGALQQHQLGGYRGRTLIDWDFYAGLLNHRFFLCEDALDLGKGPLDGIGLLTAFDPGYLISLDFLHGLSNREGLPFLERTLQAKHGRGLLVRFRHSECTVVAGKFDVR